MAYRVGCVPYLNAKPLVRQFRELGEASPVQVVFDVPSRLPILLESGECQAILVSSIEALRTPCRVVQGVSISSERAVKSVRILSDVPFEQIRTLTPDPSSMTSNALATILLEELFGCRPVMAEQGQARVLIGDAGMKGTGNFVLDLGAAWHELAGCPFVWAVWLGGQDLDKPLADALRSAATWGQRHLFTYLAQAADEAEIDRDVAERYLTRVMDYDLTPLHLQGLEAFRARLAKRGEVPDQSEMEFI